jgi:hypothetical protein
VLVALLLALIALAGQARRKHRARAGDDEDRA